MKEELIDVLVIAAVGILAGLGMWGLIELGERLVKACLAMMQGGF